jgi:shikimate kinase
MIEPQKNTSASPKDLVDALGTRNLVFVGLMGAGKTSIGRKVAARLGMPFADSDKEIEEASRMTIPELFERYGETEFRALEERVIHRLLSEGRRVISTGGGAFMNPAIRNEIAQTGVSVWLKADFDTLMERVARNRNRPLLRDPDPAGVMRRLMEVRYPVYAEADITVKTRDAHRDVIASEVIDALTVYLVDPESTATEAHSK